MEWAGRIILTAHRAFGALLLTWFLFFVRCLLSDFIERVRTNHYKYNIWIHRRLVACWCVFNSRWCASMQCVWGKAGLSCVGAIWCVGDLLNPEQILVMDEAEFPVFSSNDRLVTAAAFGMCPCRLLLIRKYWLNLLLVITPHPKLQLNPQDYNRLLLIKLLQKAFTSYFRAVILWHSQTTNRRESTGEENLDRGWRGPCDANK